MARYFLLNSDFVVSWLNLLARPQNFQRELEPETANLAKSQPHIPHNHKQALGLQNLFNEIHSCFLRSAVRTDPWSERNKAYILIHIAYTGPLQSTHKGTMSAERSLPAATTCLSTPSLTGSFFQTPPPLLLPGSGSAPLPQFQVLTACHPSISRETLKQGNSFLKIISPGPET